MSREPQKQLLGAIRRGEELKASRMFFYYLHFRNGWREDEIRIFSGLVFLVGSRL